MKTRGLRTGAWLGAIAMVLAILASGCGAPSGASDREAAGTAPAASTNAAPEASAPAPETVAESNAAPAEATAVVKRMERPAPDLPPSISKVMALVESGAGEEVVRAYVAASSERYELSLDQIIYLRDVGVPDGVIATMMRRGSELREKDAEAAAAQTNLVAAVAQIKEGLAANQAPTEGESAPPPAPGAAGADPAANAPAPSPVVATAPPPPEAPQPVQQFYSSLSPYGSWYQVPTYGWVWQPSVVVVNSGWMPYQHGGNWVWTDCGWYWHSEYSWGWAPFHYGRWCTYPGIGWCWVPDSVWGPSWVTWRHSDSHIGWAPLPPACGWASGVGLTWHGSGISVGFGFGLVSSCYTFVPYRNFCHRNVGHFAVRAGDHESVYHRTTVINNVIHGDNNVIVNNGVGYSQVSSRVRGEIPKARVEALPDQASQPLRADRMERGRNGNVVYRPTPVENAGGRPTALRAEVRPTPSASLAPRSSGTANPFARPATGSRLGATTPAGGKSIESRGNVAGTGSSVPTVGNTTGPRPLVNQRPTAAGAGRDTSRSYGTPAGTKAVEVRGSDASRGTGAGGTASPTLGPTRQTAPVPLSDPSRYVPARGRDNSTPTAINPRSTPTARTVAPTTRAPSVSPTTSRPTYSAPAPATTIPMPSAPRPSYSTPAQVPAMNVPRPSYSAPVAPSPSMSRPTVSTPAPAASTPANSPGTARSGSRNQPN